MQRAVARLRAKCMPLRLRFGVSPLRERDALLRVTREAWAARRTLMRSIPKRCCSPRGLVRRKRAHDAAKDRCGGGLRGVDPTCAPRVSRCFALALGLSIPDGERASDRHGDSDGCSNWAASMSSKRARFTQCSARAVRRAYDGKRLHEHRTWAAGRLSRPVAHAIACSPQTAPSAASAAAIQVSLKGAVGRGDALLLERCASAASARTRSLRAERAERDLAAI